MRTKIIVVVVVLSGAAWLATWGQTPPDDVPPATAEIADGNNPPTNVDGKPSEASRPQPGVARKRPHATEAEDRESERLIRAESAALMAEYNAGDAEAFATKFVPKGEYEMESGEVRIGREAIQEYFADVFVKHPRVAARIKESTIRLISLHTAIEEGTAGVVDGPDEAEVESRFVSVWTFLDGRWRLASVRELSRGSESGGAETAHEHLLSLEWLVGDWIDESPDSLVKTSCRWSEDGNFLLQDFTVQVQGAAVMSGTQRIGWDPLTRKVRSWVFDSRGGFGEGFWNWDGERWVVRSSAVRSDGKIAASLNFIIPLGNDSYRWESSHRMSDDEPLPDVSVLVVRQGPQPGSTLPGDSNE